MASLNQISYNILNLIRGGRSSNTEHLSLDQIKHMVKYYRSLMIRRDQERNFNRSNPFEQELGHLDLENVDSAELLGVYSGNTVAKTVKKLPTPIRLKRREAITYISIDDKVGTPIPLLDAVRTPWQQYNKYTKDEPFAFLRDGYLYIDGEIFSDRAYVRGVFEDPEKVHEFTRANGLDLYDEDSDFPISDDMLEAITKGIISGELRIVKPEDNDTTTDTLQGE